MITKLGGRKLIKVNVLRRLLYSRTCCMVADPAELIVAGVNAQRPRGSISPDTCQT